MDLISIISLSMAMLILAASPGPGVFATVARALSSGFRPAVGVIAGIVAGDIIFLGLAVFGLSVIAQAMGEFFFIIKIVGGAYLIWLGLKMWRAKSIEQSIDTGQSEKYWRGNFVSGLLITLANPKVILFYCGFLPTFMDLSKLSLVDIAIVGSVVATILFLVLAGYAYLASSARQFLTATKSTKRLSRAAGFVMVTTGFTIATKAQ